MDKADFRKLTMMVVDDELFIRSLIARMLRDMGVGEVLVASDGSDALIKVDAAAGHVDLILCDLDMPGMDGFAFVRELRGLADRTQAALPVLILTGHAEQENVTMAVRLGIHGFVAKPVSLATLESHIDKALHKPPIDPARLGLAK